MLNKLGLFCLINSRLNSLEFKDIKYENDINKSKQKTINWILSVNIEALNPPYKVYKRELIITIDAVIHRSATDI